MHTDLQYPIGRVQLLEYSDAAKEKESDPNTLTFTTTDKDGKKTYTLLERRQKNLKCRKMCCSSLTERRCNPKA